VKPYYEDDHVTIYHGDSREIVGDLSFDVIVMDPPYGINLDTDYSTLHGSTRSYGAIAGDDEAFDLAWWLERCESVVAFGVDHFAQSAVGGTWHVWDKRVDARPNMFADCEFFWTSFHSGPSRVLRYQWVAGVHPGARRERIAHPTVKPVPVMEHAVSLTPEGVVLDPHMGSGSTLRAAKNLGRKAIGIEIDERYCEIAAKRMGQEVLDLGGAA
jgi:site-specific DNA-methyltransferase (adenine-specific)